MFVRHHVPQVPPGRDGSDRVRAWFEVCYPTAADRRQFFEYHAHRPDPPPRGLRQLALEVARTDVLRAPDAFKLLAAHPDPHLAGELFAMAIRPPGGQATWRRGMAYALAALVPASPGLASRVAESLDALARPPVEGSESWTRSFANLRAWVLGDARALRHLRAFALDSETYWAAVVPPDQYFQKKSALQTWLAAQLERQPTGKAWAAQGLARDVPLVPLAVHRKEGGRFNGRTVALRGWDLSPHSDRMFRLARALPPESHLPATYVHELAHHDHLGERPLPISRQAGRLHFRLFWAYAEATARAPTFATRMESRLDSLQPGDWLGKSTAAAAAWLGGGQLGRMVALTALMVGVRRGERWYARDADREWSLSQRFNTAPPGGW